MQLNLQTRFPEFKSQGLWTLRLCVCSDASGLEGGDSTLEELFAGFLQMKPVPAALPRKLSPLISPNADTGRLRSFASSGLSHLNTLQPSTHQK